MLQSPYFDNCHKDSNLMQHIFNEPKIIFNQRGEKPIHRATEHTPLKYTISTAFTIYVLLRIFLHLCISKQLKAVKTLSPRENSFDLKVTCISTAELICPTVGLRRRRWYVTNSSVGKSGIISTQFTIELWSSQWDVGMKFHSIPKEFITSKKVFHNHKVKTSAIKIITEYILTSV